MKLIEMKNHFYAKGFKPLRITACGGYRGYYNYSTAHFGNPPTLVSNTKHKGTVCRYSMPRIVACGGYMGCYCGSRDPEPDPYPKPGRGWQENCGGQENNGCGAWTQIFFFK